MYRHGIGLICQIMVVFISQCACHSVFHRYGLTKKRIFLGKRCFPHPRSYFRLVYQCFGGNAADIDTCTSIHHVRSFDDCDILSTFCELGCKSFTSFAKTDNNDIILFHTCLFLIIPLFLVERLIDDANYGIFLLTVNGQLAGDVGN